MNQAKNPEYRNVRVDTAVEQCDNFVPLVIQILTPKVLSDFVINPSFFHDFSKSKFVTKKFMAYVQISWWMACSNSLLFIIALT